ncbi:MAG: M20/M25/M40 family metallo-hydrolase [Gemmatimonadales bacterium]
MIRFRFALMLVAALPSTAAAQSIAGFTAPDAARQRTLEGILDTLVTPVSVRDDSRALSAVPHIAGTPAQHRTAEYVNRALAAAGWDTSSVSFRVYIPFQDSAVVELIKPSRKRLSLNEPALREDPATHGAIWPAMNGYSGVGDVTGAVVYANYGLPTDYAQLDSMGVSVRGKVVIARYGRSYRGIKAREAEANGAIALILYSDPQDDGYFVGPTYPAGPMRHPDSPQRGSLGGGDSRGDLSTPGWASTDDARRLPQDSIPGPTIPVIPVGYRNAQLILQPIGGPEVPQSWQGGLPFRYRVGGSEVEVRVGVWAERGEAAYKTITNTIAVLKGTTWPDRLVIAGGHRDAWGPGAADNVSGVATILEAGRAVGTAATAGFRPKRSIVLATWDAEEWGLVGSTEYVELMAEMLRQQAVAYLNLDMSAFGRHFGASGTASLWAFIRDLAADATQPGDTVSVRQAARRDRSLPDSVSLPIGNLGGGSDFAGFYNMLGIPAFDFGFGGRYGAYHSAYDSFNWMDRFGDPGYLSHAAAARMTATAVTRLANADLLPFNFAEFGHALGALVAVRRDQASRARMEVPGWAQLDSAVAGLVRAGTRLDSALTVLSAATGRRAPDAADLSAANDSLRVAEQAYVRPEGIPGRPFYLNVLFAPGRDDGYGAVGLPGLQAAIEDGDAALAASEVRDLTERTSRAAATVEGAVNRLAGGGS